MICGFGACEELWHLIFIPLFCSSFNMAPNHAIQRNDRIAINRHSGGSCRFSLRPCRITCSSLAVGRGQSNTLERPPEIKTSGWDSGKDTTITIDRPTTETGTSRASTTKYIRSIDLWTLPSQAFYSMGLVIRVRRLNTHQHTATPVLGIMEQNGLQNRI